MTMINPSKTYNRRSNSSMSDMMSGPVSRVQRRAFFFAVAVILTIFMFSARSSTSPSSSSSGHIVVVDAGSSGSRAHVFRYTNGIVDPKHESFKTKPGLSSYASKPLYAGASLDPLLAFARQHVPESEVARTKIVLKATAGMRLLAQDSEREAVMANVQAHLLNSGFSFAAQDAEVIDGKEEGMLGWLAVNYLNDKSGSSGTNDEWGVLEMGGASVQFTMPMEASSLKGVPNEYKRSYRSSAAGGLAGMKKKKEVFTHSFLGLGMQSAREAVNKALKDSGATQDPCLQASYLEEHEVDEFSGVASITPAGDFEACSNLVRNTLFQSTSENNCEHPQCFYNGVFAPPSLKQGKFWAFENFFYTPSALGLPRAIAVEDLAKAGKDVCALNWKQVDTDFPKDDQPKDVNEKWCFGSAYLLILFTEGFGFKPDQPLTIGNSVGDNGIDWALGAALQAVLESKQKSS